MTNDVNAVEKKFFSSLGNGVNAGAALFDLVQSVVSSRDTTILTRQIKRAEQEKKDAQAAGAIRLVTKAVFPGAKVAKDKNGQTTIKIKGVEADQEALARFQQAVEKKLSIRHAAFRKTVAPSDTPAEKTDAEKVEQVKKYLKRQIDDGLSLDAIIAAAQAMRHPEPSH